MRGRSDHVDCDAAEGRTAEGGSHGRGGSSLPGRSQPRAFLERAALAWQAVEARAAGPVTQRGTITAGCGQLHPKVKLPACLSLGVAGRDTSGHALLMHLRQKAAHMQANQQLTEDVTTMRRAWTAIRRRFTRRGVRTPRQLVLDPRGKNPAWLEPLRRVLCVVETRRLFPRLNLGEDVPEDAPGAAA